MFNIINGIGQLEQNYLPVYHDKVMSCVVIDVILKHPAELLTIVPMMGEFHMVEAAMPCLGKYLQRCGLKFH